MAETEEIEPPESLSDSGSEGTAESAMTEHAATPTPVVGKKSKAKMLLDMVFPQLTLDNGSQIFTRKKSALVISILYASHIFSAWGDRMWGFVLSLFLVYLYPGSLLLPGLFGVLVQLTVAVFGTIVGDWVDSNPRMRVIWISLLTQNGLLTLCSVLLALMFGLGWTICDNIVVFGALIPLVILLGAGANLATIANTISVEKDWIVVLADKNEDNLAVLNSNMRRIDLCCKLLAPALTGVVLQWTSPLTTTLFVATWNIVSFFAELGLIWLVYRLVPTLASKKLRKSSEVVEEEKNKAEESSNADSQSLEDDDECLMEPVVVTSKSVMFKSKAKKLCSKLLTPLIILKNGWRIYIRQEIALVGFAMASIYLTVLGFSGVTSAYFLIQGVPNYLIGICQGIGALFGVSGTLVYPFIRKRFGTVRTGLFGISTQLTILMFCVASVFVPSHRVENNASGYYSPVCDDTAVCHGVECDMTDRVVWTASVVVPTPTQATLFPTPTSSRVRTHTPSRLAPTPSRVTTHTPSQLTPTPSPTHSITPHLFATPTPPPPSQGSQINVAVILLLIGVVGCRIGLWTFDLAVQQLVQEKVKEEERGVVGGVMNAMNSIMDMLHYVLVIAAPRPEHFNWLTLISVAMVTLGLVLYGAYIRRTRGHFFHFGDCYRCIKKWVEKRRVSDREAGVATDSFVDEDTVHLLSEIDDDNDD